MMRREGYLANVRAMPKERLKIKTKKVRRKKVIKNKNKKKKKKRTTKGGKCGCKKKEINLAPYYITECAETL